MPGQKGWRSPHPRWWVDEANARLSKRALDKKALAAALRKGGRPISEMMVLRALHPVEAKRVATIETLDAISDALGMPRPIVVAATFEQALELQATISFSAVDADRLRIAAEVDRQQALRDDPKEWSAERDGRRSRNPGTMAVGRARTEKP